MYQNQFYLAYVLINCISYFECDTRHFQNVFCVNNYVFAHTQIVHAPGGIATQSRY